MTIRTRIKVRIYDYARAPNVHPIARFAILDAVSLRELYVTRRRRQEDQLDRILDRFEGGEWRRTEILRQPSGDLLMTYERDLVSAYDTARFASMQAAEDCLETQEPEAKAAALARWNEAFSEARRLGMALNEAEAAAEENIR